MKERAEEMERMREHVFKAIKYLVYFHESLKDVLLLLGV